LNNSYHPARLSLMKHFEFGKNGNLKNQPAFIQRYNKIYLVTQRAP